MAVMLETDSLYGQVQHFYARQMQALDSGRFEIYAGTFTDDGTFQHTPGREPARGRDEIVKSLVEFHERFKDDPVQRRHWFNHIALEAQPDGSINSTVYALVVTTRPGGKPEIAPSCVVHDVVVRDAGKFYLRSRSVSHDQFM